MRNCKEALQKCLSLTVKEFIYLFTSHSHLGSWPSDLREMPSGVGAGYKTNKGQKSFAKACKVGYVYHENCKSC